MLARPLLQTTAMSSRRVEILQPSISHTHTVIFLHGRGSTAAEFVSEFFESQSSGSRTLPEIFPPVRWVFPTSGILPSRSFGDISQWFEMLSTDSPAAGEGKHQAVIEAAVSRILEVVGSETTLLGDPRRIVLAGISQGCAIAIQALLKQEFRLGGFMGLSSWLPASLPLMEVCESTKRVPVFLAHSKDDTVIAIKYGEQLRNTLKERGMVVEWHEYEDGGHWVNEPQGIGKVIRSFVLQQLAVH
jgi:predicted esterase